MDEWQEYATKLTRDAIDNAWVWFDSLSREEWLVVLAACCACGFFFLKSWGKRGPC
ncbi:MAG: hypothetical protein AAF266_05915 [Planctomycetota bacterium]